jgi:hypothetical protein
VGILAILGPDFVINVKVRLTILPVVLYRCETWFPTSREEYRLRVVENRVPRKVLGLRGMK